MMMELTDNSAIDGHQMVFERKWSDTDHDIYETDLVTGKKSSVTMSSNDDRYPDISEGIVVWQSRASGGKWQIY